MKFCFYGIILFALSALSAESVSWQAQIIRDFKRVYGQVDKPVLFETQTSNIEAASAHYDGKSYKVIIQSGLLSSSKLTADGLRMILCHEVGHLLGGAPRKDIPPEWDGPVASDGRTFYSSEGQADYYASYVCFPKVVAGQNHRLLMKSLKVPAFVKHQCDGKYLGDTQDSLVCQRAALGSMNFLTLTYPFPISHDTPDTSVSPVLLRNEYPGRQCRLDTMMAGSLCLSPVKLVLDFFNHGNSDCPTGPGARPPCWFKESGR